MNKIFTLFVMGIVCLYTNTASAQLNENFNNGLLSLESNCWKFHNIIAAATTITNGNNSLAPIEGAYSIKQDAAGSTGQFSTPFYNVSTSLNVSFKYKISNKLSNQATRVIEIGTVDKNNNFVAYSTSITLSSSNTQNNSNAVTYNGTINTTGIYRIGVRITSNNGDGNSTLLIDELQITPVDATKMTLHYAASCNSVPVVNNDTYTSFGYTLQYFSKSVLENDIDNNTGEILTAVIDQPSADGKVELNLDGSFTFTPNAGFTGTSTTFTYRSTDNGYEPSYTVATVTINFADAIILPVRFTSFTGSADNNKANLTWNVAENETGNYFEVEKSTHGREFKSIATVLCGTANGSAKYTYADAGFSNSGTYYRIKVINNNGSSSYTQTIFVKGTTSNNHQLTLLQNPAISHVTFAYQSSANSAAQVTIYNAMGTIMHTQKLTINKGTNTVTLPLDGQFTKGHYILDVTTAGSKSTTKFVKL